MAKAIATNLITNATTGYVVIRPDEVLIMDTDDIEKATKVWRWNSGGPVIQTPAITENTVLQ